ncbi:MAG: carboxypeptidase-like regulatory domain-containing protein, partial [Bacteroidota bacterium]
GSRPVQLLQMVILSVSFTLAGQDFLPDITVTLSARNSTINQVLDELTLQTGYNFTFNTALVSGDDKVHFQANRVPLQEALDKLLDDSRLKYRVIDRNIVIYKTNDMAPSPVAVEIDRSILKGRVVDKRSGKPLDYATISLYGSSLGSVSNETGDFSFKIPPSLQDPLLVISYMGYKNLFLPVTYPVDQDLTIRMERETIPLQEVIIRYTDPVSLLREAMKRIPDNYSQDHASMIAYYRESVRRDEHCMVFSEAVLDVAKGPYSPYSQGDNVRIRKGRKISDTSTEDTVLIKLRSGIYSSLSLDVVKDRPDFLSQNFADLYDLDFTDMMTYGDRLVYVISFKQKSHIPDLMFRGKIYLDQETLAILAVDFEYNPELIHKEPGLFLVSRAPRIHIRPMLARYHTDYRKLDGRFYVSQVRAEVEMKVRNKRKWMGARYRITIEMAITDVIPGEKMKIQAADRVKVNTVLADQPFDFDPFFWGIYNTIEPEATLMESLQRIQHNLQEINK